MLNYNSHHLQSPYQDEIQSFCSNFQREIKKKVIFLQALVRTESYLNQA